MNMTEVYQETAITTQSRGQIVVLLYEKAIQSLGKAVTCIEKKDYEAKSQLISRARDIICELNQALNFQEGGDLAQNLRMLYNFLFRFLGRANIRNDSEMILKSIGILEDLAGAWRKIAQE